MKSPVSTVVRVKLDVDRSIEFTALAQFRMGQLEKAFSLEDLGNRARSYAAMVSWLWACLVPEDAEAFATPESLVPHVPMPRYLELMKALAEAVKAAREREKNGNGSTPKPSPSSS